MCDEPRESVIRMRRLKMFVFFVPAFVLVGLSLIWDPKPWINMPVWEECLFGVLAVIVFFLCVIFPQRTYLTLSSEGLAIQRPMSRRVYAWNEVHDFRVVDGPSGTGIRIVWNLSDESPHKTGMIRAASAINGYDLSLLDTFSLGAEDLVQTLNEWQQEFGQSAPQIIHKDS